MSSTVSDSDSVPNTDSPPPPARLPTTQDRDQDRDPTSNPDIDLTSQPAVVTWRGLDGLDRSLPHLSLDLHYNVRSSKAFFKLHATASLKAHPRSHKTNLYLLIHPERVRTLTLDEFPSPCPDTVKLLGPDATCLRFDLTKAPTLILPKDPVHPRNQMSGNILDSLRALSQQTSLAVYSSMSSRTLPRRRLLSLCEAASTHNGLRSIAAHSNINSLYAGNGGRIFEGGGVGVSTPAAVRGGLHVTPEIAAEEPPSYNEVPPGPGPQLQTAPSNPNKRRRCSPDPVEGLDRKFVKDICAQMLDEKLVDLRRDVTKQLQDLEARVIDYVDESLSAQREQITEDVDSKIEDEYHGLKLDLQSYIREEMEETEGKILDQIGSASFSLQLNT